MLGIVSDTGDLRANRTEKKISVLKDSQTRKFDDPPGRGKGGRLPGHYCLGLIFVMSLI